MAKMEQRDMLCNCCQLGYEIEIDVNEMTPFQCPDCVSHRDAAALDERLARAQEHERMHLRRHNEVLDWADSCEARMKSAYHTRGKLLAVLNQINAIHDLRADGVCRCKAKNCKVARLIADDRIIFSLVRDYDKREQERLRRLERDDYWGYVDDWDDFIDPEVVSPRRPNLERGVESA